MRFCCHGDNPCGENVVNGNMSGRLKSKLMKPMRVVLGNVKINLCIWFLCAAFGSNSRSVSLCRYLRYLTCVCFIESITLIVQPKMIVFSFSASFTYSHVVPNSSEFSSVDHKRRIFKECPSRFLLLFHIMNVNGNWVWQVLKCQRNLQNIINVS